MFKRLLLVISVIALLTPPLASPLSVRADAVMGNEFYSKNRDKTETLSGWRGWLRGKIYIINSPSGRVIPREEPGSYNGIPTTLGYRNGYGYEDYVPSGDVWAFTNGTRIALEAAYLLDGEYWGIMPPSHMYQPPGWIRMDEILVSYTNSDFYDANKDNFYDYTGDCNAGLTAKSLVLWPWPGTDQEKIIIGDKESITNHANIIYACVDKEGREWGMSGSMMWICLSDPENKNIPSFYPAPAPYPGRWRMITIGLTTIPLYRPPSPRTHRQPPTSRDCRLLLTLRRHRPAAPAVAHPTTTPVYCFLSLFYWPD